MVRDVEITAITWKSLSTCVINDRSKYPYLERFTRIFATISVRTSTIIVRLKIYTSAWCLSFLITIITSGLYSLIKFEFVLPHKFTAHSSVPILQWHWSRTNINYNKWQTTIDASRWPLVHLPTHMSGKRKIHDDISCHMDDGRVP